VAAYRRSPCHSPDCQSAQDADVMSLVRRLEGPPFGDDCVGSRQRQEAPVRSIQWTRRLIPSKGSEGVNTCISRLEADNRRCKWSDDEVKDNPALPGGSLKSKPTWGTSQNVPHVGFFIGPLALRQERQHHKSREIKKFATGCVHSHNLGSDDHGRLSKPTDQRPKPKSLVRLLPASAIRPVVWLRQGR
jgi:hypothetical protein